MAKVLFAYGQNEAFRCRLGFLPRAYKVFQLLSVNMLLSLACLRITENVRKPKPPIIVFYFFFTYSVVKGPAASPGTLLEMQMLSPYPRPT